MPESKKELKCLPMHNKEQEQAIMHQNGPMLVLAGPGSGKTYVITKRINNLLSTHGIPPEKILVITFTKAAAKEMRDRAILLNPFCSYVNFGTFHSVFYQILKKSNPQKKYSLISDKERYEFIYSIVSTMKNIDLSEMSIETETIIKEISINKNKIITKSDFSFTNNYYHDVYKEYNQFLKEQHKIDFDDMLLECYDLLINHEKMRLYWQSFFDYILIDEFQDINSLQYEVIKLLSRNKNVFAVGDDDQAIYSFRGAKPELMRVFLSDYHAKLIQLKYNYRSHKDIVDASIHLISHNENRFSKTIFSVESTSIDEKCDSGYGGENKKYENKEHEDVFVIKGLKNKDEEYEFLRNEIMSYHRNHSNKTQAILLRTNREVHNYQNIFRNSESKTFKEDILSYLLFMNCGFHRRDFLRIMNKPLRYISPSILSEEQISFRLLKERSKEKPWLLKRLEEFEKQIMFANSLDYCGQVRYICKAMGYEAYYESINGNDFKSEYLQFLELLNRADNIEMLKQIIEKENEFIYTNKYLKNFHVLTYHGSKGLEYDRVYLPGLNFGKVPHGRLLTKEEIEEERRMFYVALTRAKENLILTYHKNQVVSPFINEVYSSSPYNSSNSTLSKYSSKASSTFSYSSSSSM